MTRLLCYDISADHGVVGIFAEGSVIAEHRLARRDDFAATVERLLREHQLAARDFTAIALGNGPGSFTGLRVGLAFAKGFGFAASIPVWPVSSLQAIAFASRLQSDRIAVISPARRGCQHLALFSGRDLSTLRAHEVLEDGRLPDLLDSATCLVGPGIHKLTVELRTRLEPHIPPRESAHLVGVEAVADLAREQWEHRTAPVLGTLSPDYGLDFGQ